MLSLSPTLARRLAIARQRLAGPRPPANAASILDAARDLGCLQLDPISVVARSHLLVLWSRFGVYDPAHLENLLWRERRLFEYWAHVASIVLTEDYPIHQGRMRDYASGDAPWEQRTRAWVQANDALRQRILARLREAGPMLARDFKDKTEVGWISGGWTTGRNVNQMLDYLWARGEIMVAGRSGLQKLWDLSERCLPDWTPRQTLSECE
ncbi:MAG: DNA glycosylase AlkZ-like family protein, partial [Anaerolineae bacterium]